MKPPRSHTFWLRFSTILNRTQLLVVGFFVLVWIALVAILVLAPDIYTETLRKSSKAISAESAI